MYEKIITESKSVNEFWNSKRVDDEPFDFSDIVLDFGKYELIVKNNIPEIFTLSTLPRNTFTILDKSIGLGSLFAKYSFVELEASEAITKNIDFIEAFIFSNKEMLQQKVLVAVGGGVVLDTALCIAQILKLKIILVPTTIISMSDSSIGGKARANKISGKNFLKHFYRANYDPTQIILCPEFLNTIPDKYVLFSCAEIIKHAFFQSEDLVNYLCSDDFDPFKNKASLFKAILWAADLKRVCMKVDPKETEEGSRKIIREGHALADKLEKESKFSISHGEAVLHGIEQDLKKDTDLEKYERFQNLCKKLTK